MSKNKKEKLCIYIYIYLDWSNDKFIKIGLTDVNPNITQLI